MTDNKRTEIAYEIVKNIYDHFILTDDAVAIALKVVEIIKR